jgi:guanine deaminase
MNLSIVRGPLLDPRPDGSVRYFADGVLVGNERGRIVAAGDWVEISRRLQLSPQQARAADGWIIPPLLDAHIHIPQHPIRGQFLAGVEGNPPEGPLIAGLNRNVFPAEGKCSAAEVAAEVVQNFRDDTLSQGVIGGAAYMTVHTPATRRALAELGDAWHVGLVMMERNCPEYLRTDDPHFERDVESLAKDFGARLVVTDRFAGAVDSPLRKRGVALSEKFGLRMQTHLNEQFAEKAWIEGLYPQATSYTDVYRRDGLLAQAALMAHCIRMSDEEFDLLAAECGAAIVHCPVSNTLLGSGVMPLDKALARRIPYAICTDVGASPTTSLLNEMVQFLRVHRGRSAAATPQEALFRTTLAPAQILGLDYRLGSFETDKEFSFIEVAGGPPSVEYSPDEAIELGLLDIDPDDFPRFEPGGEFSFALSRLEARGLEVGPDLARLTADVEQTARRMQQKVKRVTLTGKEVFRR